MDKKKRSLKSFIGILIAFLAIMTSILIPVIIGVNLNKVQEVFIFGNFLGILLFLSISLIALRYMDKVFYLNQHIAATYFAMFIFVFFLIFGIIGIIKNSLFLGIVGALIFVPIILFVLGVYYLLKYNSI